MQDNQFALFKSKRFLPFFLTQGLGAFNDNVFKNSLMLILAFSASNHIAINTDVLMNVAAIIFIAPFFLFSGTAGRIADKFPMQKIIRLTKIAEVIIMLLGAMAFYFEAYNALLLILFLMGTQSAFFGPVKYAILPRTLKKDELVGGNALIEMGTFVAILVGTIVGGLLVDLEQSYFWISLSVICFSLLGYIVCLQVPHIAPSNPKLEISLNIFSQTLSSLKISYKHRDVFLSMMAISWFWFIGASYLTQVPNYTKIVLMGNSDVVTFILAVFSISIAMGALICEKLSSKKIELGIVPIGSIGLSIFGIDLFFATPNYVSTELMGLSDFLSQNGSFRVLMDISFIGFFGGLYSVPLMALVQQRSDDDEKAQTIAALNILNAMFMLVSGISGVLFLGLFKLSIPEYFAIISIMNIVVAIFIYSQVTEFLVRFVVWMVSHSLYRVSQKGLEHIPEEGPAVLVCNHVSYMDAMILAGACKRPVRFVMDKNIFDNPGLNWFFRLAKTIPIASQQKHPDIYHKAMDSISREIQEGHVVCIFPEGKLTKDGHIDTFKKGIETIIHRDPVPVIPMALQGLWGSFFSHQGGAALTTLPSRFWSKVNIVADSAWQPDSVSADTLEAHVKLLRDENA